MTLYEVFLRKGVKNLLYPPFVLMYDSNVTKLRAPNLQVMCVYAKLNAARQDSSMIHSAKPTFSPIVNIVFTWNLFCFEKWGRTDGRKYVRTTCVKWSLPAVFVGRPSGSIATLAHSNFSLSWRKRWEGKLHPSSLKRGVDSRKSKENRNDAFKQLATFGHYMSICLFSLSFIGHILD